MSDPSKFPTGSGDGGNQDMCNFLASFFHERQSIDRLLDWIRQTQTACTDTNCFADIDGAPGTELGQLSLRNRELQQEQAADVENFTPLILLFLGLLTMLWMNMGRRREGSSAMD